jgi:hypothetical protein
VVDVRDVEDRVPVLKCRLYIDRTLRKYSLFATRSVEFVVFDEILMTDFVRTSE